VSDVLKGHGFSRAAEAAITTLALAPEGMKDCNSPGGWGTQIAVFECRINSIL